MAETAPQTVPVFTPDGAKASIPAEQLGEALKAGYTQPTPEQVQAEQFREEHDSPGKSFGLGALSGATLGLGNELLNKTGLSTPESQAAYREQRPGYFGAGQLVGSVAPIALTEGLAAPAEAGELTAAATRAAASTVEGASAAGAEAAARAAAPVVPGTLGHLAKDAAIGAGLSGGEQITEDALGDDHALAAESLVPALLGGGAMAGIAGLGLRGAAKALPVVLERSGQALDGARGTLTDFLTSRAVRSGIRDGLDEESLRLATSDPLAATDPRTLAAEQAQQLARKKGLGKELYQQTSELFDTMKATSKDFHANIRPEDASNLLANHDVEAIRDSARELITRQQVALDQLAGDADVNQKQVTKAQDLLTKAANKVESADQPGEVFNTLNDYKREQAKLSKYRKDAFGTDQEATLNGMRDLSSNVQDHLEDESVYGEAARVHAGINAQETDFIDRKANLLANFGKLVTQGGRKVRVLDADKFKAVLGAYEQGKKGAAFQSLTDFLDGANDMQKTYEARAALVPTKTMKLAPGDVQSILDAAVAAKEQGLQTAGAIARKAPVGPATAYQAIGGRIGQPAQYDKGLLGVGEAGLLMAGAHMVGVPAPLIGGAAMARAFLGGEALPPATTVKVLAMIAKAKNAFQDAADSAVGNLLKGGARKSEAILPIISEHISRGPQDFQFGSRSHVGLGDRESFQLHAQDLSAATAAPAALRDGHNQLLAGAPTIGSQALDAHQRALHVLQANLPAGSNPDHVQQANLFDAHEAASPIERQDWVNAANVLHDPLSVLPLISSGMLTTKTVGVLKAAYPATYGHLSTILMKGLADMPPKERSRMSADLVDQLSTFLGVPLSSLQKPATIAQSQMTYQQSQPQQAPMMAKRPRKTAPLKLGQRAQTPNQAADAVLAGH